MVKLKPCPFCGRELLVVEGWKGCVWVECINCNTEGPDKDTESEAIEAWNKRYTPTTEIDFDYGAED